MGLVGGKLVIKVDLKSYGSFAIRFNVKTSPESFSPWSPWSEWATIDHTEQSAPIEPKTDFARSTKSNLLDMVKIRNDYLVGVNEKTERTLESPSSSGNQNFLRPFCDELHRAVVRATAVAKKLSDLMGNHFSLPCAEIYGNCELGQALMVTLDALVFPPSASWKNAGKKANKTDPRIFQRFIAEMLECNRFVPFLSDWAVTSYDLEMCCEGASLNRLFQLLVESKKSSLEFSSSDLKSAGARTDWFKDKQINMLRSREFELKTQEAKREKDELDQVKKEQQRLQRDEEFQRKAAEIANNPDSSHTGGGGDMEGAGPNNTVDFKSKRVILQKLNGPDAVLNGRSGIVQPYDLDNDQYAVKLTAPTPDSKFPSDSRSAVTVYDYQLRLMNKKEEKKAKTDEAAAIKVEEEKNSAAKFKAEREAESRDEQLALKLVE